MVVKGDVLTRRERAHISFDDWDDEYDYASAGSTVASGSTKKRRSLSEFWRSRFSFSKLDEDNVLDAAGKERPVAFVRHLRAVRNTVRLVFNNRSLSVNWANQDESMTDIEQGRIFISPRFLKENNVEYKDWSIDQRVDACHGAAMHEAAHNKWTPANAMPQLARLGGSLLTSIFNIIEDGYIEACIMHEMPGFSGYIDALWDFYMTPQEIERRLHTMRTQDMTKVAADTKENKEIIMKQFHEFFNLLIAAMKSRNLVDMTDIYLQSKRHEKMAHAIERCVQIYRSVEDPSLDFDSRVDAALRVYRIICALFAQIEDEDEQKGPTAFVLNEEEFKKMLDEMMQSSGVGNASGKTPAAGTDPKSSSSANDKDDGGKNAIGRQTQGVVDSLLSANLREEGVEQFHSGSGGNEVRKAHLVDMRRKPWADKIYADEMAEMRRHLQRMRKALRFRSSDKQFIERERPFGKVDSTRLTDLVAFNSKDIFYRKTITSAPKAHIGVLIDESGSMRESTSNSYRSGVSKEQAARRAAIMIEAALRGEPTTTYEIWGHTGDLRGHGSSTSQYDERACPVDGGEFWGPLLMRYLDTNEGMTDPRVLGRMIGRGNNYDGYAIEVVAKHMAENSTSPLKVLFIVCDGMPAGSMYGSPANIDHTREQVNKARKRGVEVISIFVGNLGAAEANMFKMYGRKDVGWFHVADSAQLPVVMEKLSTRMLKWTGA